MSSTPSSAPAQLSGHIANSVRLALEEDIGTGDATAKLVPIDSAAQGSVVVRKSTILCGRAWFDAVFARLDSKVLVTWHAEDGERLTDNSIVCEIRGPARSILTGERTALNFLQTLSGTATSTAQYVDAVQDHLAKILDTRKTLPGLRLAQKYAVRCGGGTNHRAGLYDAILIKENHIMAAGSIAAAVATARQERTTLLVEVEVETLEEVREALAAQAGRLLLDNFSLEMLAEAVSLRNEISPDIGLEASGGITLENIAAIAATGVDFISVGALTKDLVAADFSLRLAL
jgi:nicotinate-nucleotide pyrophosphorylase (carboxylating)